MKKNDKGSRAPGAVADLVNEMLQNARSTRVDGPSSMLHGARAQLSKTVNQAGTLLAKLDRAAPPAHKPSLLQSVLGLAATKAPPKKRSWFFASREAETGLSTKRIEHLLKEASKDGVKISFERATKASGEDVHCELPEGAADPVCAPRK